MFDGFRPELQGWFFERRILPSAVTLGVLLAGGTLYIATSERTEKTVEVALGDPELSDLVVEDETPEIEDEEPAAEAPPPPPPEAKIKPVKKRTPRPRPATPVAKPTDAADETSKEKAYEAPRGGRTSRTGMGGGTGKPAAAGKAKKPAKPPKPKLAKKAKREPLDPTKPVDRPENATVPKPLPSNVQPSYPKKLRDEGISGRVVLKLHVHRDGSVRGAKVLSKKNSATTEEEKTSASAAFLKSIIKVVKSWRFTPATLAGKPISVWHKVNIPFELTD